MKSLRRIPAVLLAALLALSTGIGIAPGALLAAPVTQTDATVLGYWESDVLPSADTDGLVVGLLLYEDGSAEVISDYQNDEDPILEVGEWVENEDGTLTLTVTGTSEGDYEAPIDLVFNVEDDGSLVIPGAPDGIFGEAGLALFPAEIVEEDAVAEETDDAADDATDDATGSATAALLAELPDDALVYQSEVMPAASSPGLQLTLLLYSDSSLELVSDYMTEGEVVFELGTWIETEDGIEITLTGQDDGTEYPDPLVLLFVGNEAGGLDLVDEDGALFGEAGLSLAPVTADGTAADDEAAADDTVAMSMTEAPAGAYVSDLLPSDDGVSTFLVALLYDDTSMIITTYTTDGTLPETEIGEWVANEDGTYVLNITGTPDEEYDEPVALDFTLEDDGTLDIFGIPLYPLEDFDMAGEGELVAEFQSEVMPAASSPGLQITLSLYDDFSAEMVSDYQNDDEVVLEYGEWDVNDDGQLLLSVTGQDDVDYDTPVDYVFDMSDDGLLTLAESSNEAFGAAGLTLAPLEVDASLDEDLGEMATDDGTVDEGTVDDGSDVMVDFTDIYTAELTVAGSDIPAVVLLGFTDDGLVALDLDYQDGEETETYYGEWVDNEDGTYTITLTEGPEGELDEPLEVTMSEDDDGALTVVEANEAAADLLDLVFTYVDLGAE